MAKKIKISRKDLKRPDEFISASEKLLLWAENNAYYVLGGALAILLLMLLIRVGSSALSGRGEKPRAEFATAMATLNSQIQTADAAKFKMPGLDSGPNFSSEAERNAAALKQFEAVAKTYRSTPEGDSALLYLGSIHEKQKDYDKAIQSYQDFAKTSVAGKEKGYRIIAQIGEAGALYKKADYAKAADTYNLVIGQDSIMKPEAMIGAARCYFALGQPDKANEILDQVKKDFPDAWSAQPANFLATYWKGRADGTIIVPEPKKAPAINLNVGNDPILNPQAPLPEPPAPAPAPAPTPEGPKPGDAPKP